jgi:hypothetical protein
MYGLHAAAPPGDTLEARYATKNGDGILNCGGQPYVGGVNPYVFDNQFSINKVGQLVCTTETGTTYVLVGDDDTKGAVQDAVSLQNMQFSYGVNAAGTSTNVDTYKTADQMSAADWSNVISVQITLTFTNPLYSDTNVGQGTTMPQTVSFSRVVNIMRQTGV